MSSRHFAKRPIDASRRRGRRHPPPERVPAPSSHARAGVGGRRRCGEPGEARREKRARRGFVNAVLRAISQTRDTLPLPSRPTDTSDRDAALDYLSITAVASALAGRRGGRPVRLRRRRALDAVQQPPCSADAAREPSAHARATSCWRSCSRPTSRRRPTRFAPDGFVVERGHPLRGPGLDDGWFVVQDEASQLVALLAGDRPGPLVLDTCASPGGKTTAHRGALPVAREPGTLRLSRATFAISGSICLRRTVAATGATNVRIVQADLLQPLPFRPAVRLRDRRCALLGPRHAAARSRHPLAASGSAICRRSPRRSARCCGTPPRRSRPADGWCTRRARASPRKTKRSIDRISAESPRVSRSSERTHGVAPRLPHGGRRRAADICGRCRTSTALEAFFGAVSSATDSRAVARFGYPWLFEPASGARAKAARRRSAARDVRALCGGIDAPRPARARSAGAGLHEPHGQRGDGDRRRSGSDSQGRRVRRARRQDRGRPRARAGTRRRVDGAAAAQPQSVAERGAATRPACRRSSGETERTAQLRLAQDGLALASVSEIRSPDYPSDVVLAQEPPPKSARHPRRAAREPRRPRHELRDARSDRRQRRPRGRNPAQRRLSRGGRRLESVSGRRRRHRASARARRPASRSRRASRFRSR